MGLGRVRLGLGRFGLGLFRAGAGLFLAALQIVLDPADDVAVVAFRLLLKLSDLHNQQLDAVHGLQEQRNGRRRGGRAVTQGVDQGLGRVGDCLKPHQP